jgi:hypothetical protein
MSDYELTMVAGLAAMIAVGILCRLCRWGDNSSAQLDSVRSGLPVKLRRANKAQRWRHYQPDRRGGYRYRDLPIHTEADDQWSVDKGER